MSENLSPYLDFITETAYLAGRLTLGYFQSQIQAEYKADNTPVTLADRQAEQLIRSRIEKAYPTHAILGEEFGESAKTASADHRWIIDPIDGTKSFVHGVPLYAVLIGLEIEGRVEVGAACFPALNEMLAAATGLGCWFNGRRAHVSNETSLARALVAFTSPNGFIRSQKTAAWDRLQKATYIQRTWGDAYGYALVATGRAEIMLDPQMNIWDCGPFPPILSEAGGYFGDWRGNAIITADEALGVSQALLPEVLSVLAGHSSY